MVIYTTYSSPIGLIYIYAKNNKIIEVGFEKSILKNQTQKDDDKLLKKTIKQLEEYFSGKRKTFDLPLYLEGTLFQKSVWDELINIPYGQTLSYLDVAKNINKPKAPRAVGGACNKNPIAIIVPCHRVVGSNKKLVGYASGLLHKEFLLNLENN